MCDVCPAELMLPLLQKVETEKGRGLMLWVKFTEQEKVTLTNTSSSLHGSAILSVAVVFPLNLLVWYPRFLNGTSLSPLSQMHGKCWLHAVV
ncbi:uncharacterized protein LOC125377991 isoform X2 [Haliotis rufescens]|nr:uncharacterized protein LOC125377991 isoform X2 [Haliotis rufescens]